jgi:hypothetical protein
VPARSRKNKETAVKSPLPRSPRPENETRSPWGAQPTFNVSRNVVLVSSEDGALSLLVELDELDGRWRIANVHVRARPGVTITGEVMATAPLARVEAMANAPDDELPVQRRVYATKFVLRPAVVVPEGTPYPPEFWQQVAKAYTDFVTVGGRRDPAVCIAEDAGVSVKTAQRWIAHCRSEGLLPKGRQGRPG